MDTTPLIQKFARLGARLKFVERLESRSRFSPVTGISLDVLEDNKGEFFEIRKRSQTEIDIAVLDVQPQDRHLLLLVREDREKSKYLCGHDERHWFVAGIPEKAPVGTVRQAKESLKPREVRQAELNLGLSMKERNRRKNDVFIRQGEWFFLPTPGLGVNEPWVLKNEPLRRATGRGKPHMLEFCYRTGGETVQVCGLHPNGVTLKQYQDIIRQNPKAKHWNWSVMKRNPGVYAKGRVRHADHATIILPDWHRVLMNTEGESIAMRNVAFLD